jgi:hypothetical protein
VFDVASSRSEWKEADSRCGTDRPRTRLDKARGAHGSRAFVSVPSMTLDLEVKVLWEVDRNDPSQPQGDDREGVAESSGARDLRGDVQKPDRRREDLGRAG